MQAGQDLQWWEVQLQVQNQPNKKQTLIILHKDFGCMANGLLEEFSKDPNKVRHINPIKITAIWVSNELRPFESSVGIFRQ